MFYAMILVCAPAVQFCSGVEDQRDPYDTMEACHARLEEMNEAVPTTFLPYLRMQGIPGPFQGTQFCDTIENLREQFPTAFEEVEVVEGIAL